MNLSSEVSKDRVEKIEESQSGISQYAGRENKPRIQAYS